MKKQSAVQWLVEQVNSDCLNSAFIRPELVEQAIEMEKEQKAEDWQLGYDACEFYNDYDELQREPMKNPYKNKK
jgi:hypothetical protein